MSLNIIWLLLLSSSFIVSFFTGRSELLASALLEGAQSAVTLCLAMAGAICLWSGLLRLLRDCGIAQRLERLLRPAISFLMPGLGGEEARSAVAANITANLLGLGNAATPAGVKAASLITSSSALGMLVVINSSSLQLIPSTVAALRASMGSPQPFDILPAVWLTSACSLSAAVLSARLLGGREKAGGRSPAAKRGDARRDRVHYY